MCVSSSVPHGCRHARLAAGQGAGDGCSAAAASKRRRGSAHQLGIDGAARLLDGACGIGGGARWRLDGHHCAAGAAAGEGTCGLGWAPAICKAIRHDDTAIHSRMSHGGMGHAHVFTPLHLWPCHQALCQVPTNKHARAPRARRVDSPFLLLCRAMTATPSASSWWQVGAVGASPAPAWACLNPGRNHQCAALQRALQSCFGHPLFTHASLHHTARRAHACRPRAHAAAGAADLAVPAHHLALPIPVPPPMPAPAWTSQIKPPGSPQTTAAAPPPA